MKRKHTIGTMAALLCGVWLAGSRPAAAAWSTPEEAETLLAEMRAFFAGAESRHPGSEGNLAAERAVAELFESSGLPSGALHFVAPHLRTEKALLTVRDLAPISLFPMHPTIVRPGNLKERAFDAPLVYMGRAATADLAAAKGIDLQGAIAVLEFGGGNDWMQLLRFGVRGFIFLGGDDDHYNDLTSKVFLSEGSAPRYFARPEDAATLRTLFKPGARAVQAHIDAPPTRWENRELRSPWVLIPGSHPDRQREVVVLYAPLDSNCIVPDMSYGASDAANLFLLVRLFRAFRELPPERSVLLVAVNAHTQLSLGERVLAWNLLARTTKLEAVQDLVATDLRAQELMTRYYSRFDLNPSTPADQEFIEALRTLSDGSIGRYLSIKAPVVALARRDVNALRARQLELHTSHRGRDAATLAAESAEIGRERQKYVNVLTLFNKVGIKTDLRDLSAEETGILRQYVNTVITQNRDWSERNREELARNALNARIRNALDGREVKFVLGLDFLWNGRRVAFSANDSYGSGKWQQRWGVNMAAVAGRLKDPHPAADAGEELFVDALTKRGGLVENHFFTDMTVGLDAFHGTEFTPAFAARNPYAGHGRRFSPLDTFDRLNALDVATVMNYMPALLREALADPYITNPSELRPPTGAEAATVQVETFSFDAFSASVTPELAVPDSLVAVYRYRLGQPDELQPLAGGNVVNVYFGMTDRRAAATFYTMRWSADLATAAFHFDADFVAVDHAIDAGEAETRVSSSIRPLSTSIRLALFPCVEIPIPSREDSTTISTLPIMTQKYRILSGSDDAVPKKYGMSGALPLVSPKVIPPVRGPALFFVQPGERAKIITEWKVVALNAQEGKPGGIGYESLDDMGPDFFAAATRDMAALNRERLQELQGVSDELASEFLQRGNTAQQAMEQAAREHDSLARLRYLFEALGSHFKAYSQTATITNDMLKAVVFYLALMLPFCFFVMKLLFKFVKIEQQMLAFSVLFVATFIVFRLIHPAFRIAEAPAAMFIAFVMGGMGLFVIKILHTRFEGEMQILFNTYSSVDTSQVGYSTVGQEAMLIGVNNMKRRRLRTAFTTATIILVTFTMLAFTSISKKLSPTLIKRGDQAPYTGLMYTWPGNLCMDEDTARILCQNYADRANVFVRRWILCSVKQGTTSLPIPDPLSATTGKQLLLDGVLGISAREDGFLAPIPLVCGRFFSSDEAQEVVMPSAVAGSLGITPENFAAHRVRFRGVDFQIAGILDDARFQAIKDLNQRSIMPIKHIMDQATDMTAAPGALDAASEDKAGVFYVEMSSLLLMPVDTVRQFATTPNTVASVSVRLADEAEIWPAVDEFLTMSQANKFYMSSRKSFAVGASGNKAVSPGVYYIGEGYRTSIGGLSFLLIPLLIASTIILNTMLGSVYERKSEIAVYNAVGLNPTHIGMFFLAESFVYSVIGSVGGYLIGQLLTILLTKSGLISDINLNFSSLSVVYVILFTIAVVMLSTVYPSMVATKAAVPSGKRKWALPANNGQTMEVVFPFIYQPDLIRGILGYLGAYFSRFTEASFGDLIAHLEDRSTGTDAKGRETFTLRYHLALAPFDLGVTQTGVFRAAYDDRVQAYRLALNVERISGQDTNWATTNKPFLEGLRTYLLHWRNLDASEHALYVRQGTDLFPDSNATTAG